jgi:predicted cytidylate kinase
MKYSKLTLSGYAGTGKSTVGKLLAKELNYGFRSVGNVAREYAEKEFGLSINEFQDLCRQKPELDDYVNLNFAKYCNKTEKIVADFRLGFHFVEKSFNVFLKCSAEIAAKRLQNDNRGKEKTDFASIAKRNAEMRDRFIEKYGVDFTDENNYDLVIDTDYLTPEEVVRLIISKFQPQTISTVNFHLTNICNFHCKYCFARFTDIQADRLTFPEQKELIKQLSESDKFRKINFAGGEPTLVPNIAELIKYAKSLGFETGIVTNGSKIDAEWVKNIVPFLNILAVSVDTLNYETNIKIGSNQKGKTLSVDNLKCIAAACHNFGVQLKINTVVSHFNKDGKLTDFINEIRPFRWKILQATKVIGQNDKDFDCVKVKSTDFENFCNQNRNGLLPEIKAVCESCDLISGSYIMIDFAGRFYDSSQQKYTYSGKILEIGVKAALSQISVDNWKFARREGNYSIFTD